MTDDDEPIREDDGYSLVSQPGEQESEKREEAFNAVYEWNGKVINGISASRKGVWRSLCHRAGFCRLDDCYDDISLFSPHATAIIYLCQIEDAELTVLRAKGVNHLLLAFEKWVDKNIPNHRENDALTLGLRILNHSSQNQAEALPSGAAGKP